MKVSDERPIRSKRWTSRRIISAVRQPFYIFIYKKPVVSSWCNCVSK